MIKDKYLSLSPNDLFDKLTGYTRSDAELIVIEYLEYNSKNNSKNNSQHNLQNKIQCDQTFYHEIMFFCMKLYYFDAIEYLLKNMPTYFRDNQLFYDKKRDIYYKMTNTYRYFSRGDNSSLFSEDGFDNKVRIINLLLTYGFKYEITETLTNRAFRTWYISRLFDNINIEILDFNHVHPIYGVTLFGSIIENGRFGGGIENLILLLVNKILKLPNIIIDKCGEDELPNIRYEYNIMNNMNIKKRNMIDYPDRTPLFLALSNGYFEVSELLLKHGANPQKEYGEHKHDCLMDLIYNKRFYLKDTKIILDLMIKYGYDINRRNSNGMTPLMIAAIKGDHIVIKHLLDNGAKIDIKDYHGHSALVYATMNKSEPCIVALMSAIPSPTVFPSDNIIDLIRRHNYHLFSKDYSDSFEERLQTILKCAAIYKILPQPIAESITCEINVDDIYKNW